MTSKIHIFVIKYGDVLVFTALLITMMTLSFLRIKGYDTAFTYDQAREMTEIRRMIFTKTPLLIGPATDIIGLFYGPFWAYFNSIPFVLFGGDPLGLVKFQIVVMHIFSLIIFFILRKKNKTLAFYSASLFLFSPIAAFSIKFSWNANSAYYFAALFPLFIFFKSKISSFIEGLLAGVILQVEAAVGILFFPISLYFHTQRPKKEKHFIPLILGFFMTLIPQVAFEIRHGFLMTISTLREFSGGTDWLGQKLSLSDMLLNRFTYFTSIFSGATYLPIFLIFVVIATAFIFGKQNSEVKKFLKTNLFVILVFLLFFLIFPFNIRDWYLYGLVPFSIYALASSLTVFSAKFWMKIITVFIVGLTIFLSISTKISYLAKEKGHSNDWANLNNMLILVDTVYREASGSAFKVYTYTPQIYDLRFQYLFWWYGTKNYGYQPSDMSYFPGVPEYIKDNSVFWTKKKESVDELIFLIIEHDSTTKSGEMKWRSNFPVSSRTISLPWSTTIEKIESNKK